MCGTRCKIIVGISVCALFVFVSSMALAANQKVVYCASWLIYGKDAAFVAGLERGDWKSEGMDVDFQRGYGSGDTFKKVSLGSCDYGDAGAGPAALGRLKGLKAKEISLTDALFKVTNFYFADSGIGTPIDIQGKRITGGPKASVENLMFPVFARANKIDVSKVNIIYMNPAAKLASFGAGKVDLVVAFHDQLPRFQALAKTMGKRLVAELWAHQGVDIYGNGITTSDSNIENKKDLTMRFLRGYFKSLRWAFRNREAAVDIFLKHYPEQKRESARMATDLNFEHMVDRFTEKHGFGYMDQEKMAKTIKVTLETSGVKGSLDPSEISTNEFVERLPEELRFFHKQ